MKNLITAFVLLLSCYAVRAQVTIYADDFESGTSNWSLTGQWGLASSQAYNGSYSLADSPSGNYLNNQTTYATLDSVFDLSSSLDANMYFEAKYDIENGFDYCYVEASANNGTSWTTVHTLNGENNLSSWSNFAINIGGFVGNSQVKVRFRFYTDAGYQADGIFIDSLRITKDSVDNAPPLIIHEPEIHYEGEIGANTRVVTITDISGVASAVLYYAVDNGSYLSVSPSDTNGDDYTFVIPAQDAGAYVDYYIEAVDSSAQSNSTFSTLYKYVAGNYIKYEEGEVNFITSYASSATYTGTAMKMTLDGLTTITTAFIGNYTDVNNPNDSMEFHVWADDSGEPGDDLITPFMVFPEANLQEPHKITRIDLRPYAPALDSLIGDVFIGFIVPSGTVWVGQTTPGSSGRVLNYNGSSWSSESDDYHFRIVTDTMVLPPVADFDYDLSGDPTVVFSDSSENNPTSWHWTFGDGNTDSVQNPTHTYASPSAYNVCLTVSNAAGEDELCKGFFVTNGPPNAFYSFSTANDPEISFTDLSSQNPTSWVWDFDDGDTSHVQSPVHYFPDTGDYNVCLEVANAFGSDEYCQNIHIYNRAPDAFFTYQIFLDTVVNFTDLSGFNPTAWHWDFNHNGDTSTLQNPAYHYPRTGGTFTVCLTASNQYGESAPYCTDVDIDDLTIGIETAERLGFKLMPNPAVDFVQLKIPSEYERLSYTIRAVNGAVVQQGNNLQSGQSRLELKTVSSGLYFIELQENETLIVKIPFIIQE